MTEAIKIPRIKKLAKGEALMLRTCALDGTSYGGFKWPQSGAIACKDWKPLAECGNGLHGLLWGVGEDSYLEWGEASWMVVRVKLSEIVEIGGKVKVPGGIVEYFGDRFTAVALIQHHAPQGSVMLDQGNGWLQRGHLHHVLEWREIQTRHICGG